MGCREPRGLAWPVLAGLRRFSVSSSCRSLLIAVSISLLLPDHDTKRPCVFKVGGCDPDASGPWHPNPLIRCIRCPATAAGFGGGRVGRFGWTNLGYPLHSHRVGTATLRWLADAHLEVRRRLVNSLLERLRRRLRELGRPLHEEPSSDGRRPSSRAPADDAPQCRTEIELSQRSRNADRTGSGDPGSAAGATAPTAYVDPPEGRRLLEEAPTCAAAPIRHDLGICIHPASWRC
jgi:hypothetical protein